MTSTTSANTIDRLRGLFARFGIPEILRSDGGPQLASRAFANFSKAYGFKHIMSSPHNPRSNGAVERAVQTAKRIVQQPDPALALLTYRNTPLEVTGHSPARLLMGRSLRTRLPVHPTNMTPSRPDFIALRHHHEQEKLRQKEGYDQRHGAVLLEPPSVGDEVRVLHDGEKRWQGPVRILGPAVQPNSFTVQSPVTQAPIVRNRRFILPIPTGSRPTPDVVLPPASLPAAESFPDPQASRSAVPSAAPSSALPPPSAPPPSPTSPPPGAAASAALAAASPPPALAQRPAAQPFERRQAAVAPRVSPPRHTRSGRHVRGTKRDDFYYYTFLQLLLTIQQNYLNSNFNIRHLAKQFGIVHATLTILQNQFTIHQNFIIGQINSSSCNLN